MTYNTNSNKTVLARTFMSRVLMAGVLATTVAACASQSKPEGHDYRQNHQIQVASEQVSISITLPDSGMSLAPSDDRRFRGFLRDYVQRGRSVVTVESQMGQLARDILLANGLRDYEIVIADDTTILAPNAVLSFTANKAVLPECGNFSDHPNFNPSNAPHSNYGCAYQRNIGAITSDPGDFIQAKPATGGAASRTDTGIQTHQSGAPKPRLLDSNQSVATQ